MAFLELSRLVTGFLTDYSAWDRRSEWDDIIQDVILKAISAEAAGRIRAPGAVVAFLRVSTRNRLIDHVRKGRRESSFDPTEEPEAGVGVGGGFFPWAGRRRVVEQMDLRRAVDALPDDQRVAVLSVYAEGRTYQEAADQTGIPLGSLKRYLREGLDRLGRSLGSGYPVS